MKTKKLFSYLSLALCIFLFAFNKKEKKDPTNTSVSTTTIASVLEGADFSILKAALAKANIDLDKLLIDKFTIFAPNNAAFAAAGITDLNAVTADQLAAILKYHVVAGATVTSGQITATAIEPATFLGPDKKLSVVKTADGVFVKDLADKQVKVIAADVKAQKGVIHVINYVLIPEKPVAIASVLEGADFSILKAALAKANIDLDKLLTGNFTIFAPNNAAFAAAGITDLNAVTPDQLAVILKNHVIVGATVTSDQITATAIEAATFLGPDKKLSVVKTADGVFVKIVAKQGKQMKVIAADVKAQQGVIHVINHVLIPEKSKK